MPTPEDTEAGQRGFPTTIWDDVRSASEGHGEVARRVLDDLITRYWHPVYFFIRHKGRNREEAKDLTQGFFASFLSKSAFSYADEDRGRFRSFLLASVCRYLAQRHRSDARRQHMQLPAELGAASQAWQGFEPTEGESPETVFMRNWAKRLVECCMDRLREECLAEGKEPRFRVFRARFLQARPPDAKTIAGELGMSVENVANHLRWAKRRFSRLLKAEVQRHVAAPEDVDQEIRELLSLLRQ